MALTGGVAHLHVARPSKGDDPAVAVHPSRPAYRSSAQAAEFVIARAPQDDGLNVVRRHTFAFPQRILRPSDVEIVAVAALKKSEGAGKAGVRLTPRSRRQEQGRAPASEQVQPGSPRLSLHNGLTAYSVLSPAAHCATVIATNVLRLVGPVGRLCLRATSTPALGVRTTRLRRTPTSIGRSARW
jgi:hypothetical protein